MRGPATCRARRRAVAAALLLAALTGCSAQNALSQQARAGDDKGYVAGDGRIVELGAGQRGDPVDVTGKTAEGAALDVADWRGDVVVLNVWYAACAPCRAEAPDLARISAEYEDQGVRFLGINTRDDAAQVLAFGRTFDITYPSLLDAGDGSALLALRGEVSPQAVPTTLLLDREGRVAARVAGLVEGDVLEALLDTVLKEPA